MLPYLKECSELLRKKKLRIAAAESCTGGLIAKLITDLAGASDILETSLIAYSNRIKEEKLKVPHEIIAEFTEVSKECAEYMAKGVKAFSSAEIGVSTTGYAGPTGKEVGLVYICVDTPEKVVSKELRLTGNREEIREKAAEKVFETLYGILK